MSETTIGAAFEAAQSRNAQLCSAYKGAARSLLSRSASNFAASAADQRQSLAKALSEIVPALAPAIANQPLAFSLPAPLEAPPHGETAAVFAYFKTHEDIDAALYAALATAIEAFEEDAAIRLRNFADEAHKRSALIADHLDLLALS